MPNNGSRITAPVRLDVDVPAVTGYGSYDVATQILNAPINMWSRGKPIVHASIGALTDAQIKDLNFGLTIPIVSPGNIPGSKMSEQNLYYPTYARPEIGSPFRLSDWNNYNKVSVHPIGELRIENQQGGKKPVIVPSQYIGTYYQSYLVRLVFNQSANIRLDELALASPVSASLADLYLTLIIGTNMNGLSITEAKIWQSVSSVGEAISNGSGELYIDADTSRLVEDQVLITNQTIVFVYLAPHIDNSFRDGGSLKFRPNLTGTTSPTIETTFYDTYATMGDGGEGGVPPLSQVMYTLSWNSGTPPALISQSDGYYMSFDFVFATITSSQYNSAFAVKAYIDELGRDYTIGEGALPIPGGGSSIIIDTGLNNIYIGNLINPNTGNRFTQLTVRVNLVSMTAQVAYGGTGIISTINL